MSWASVRETGEKRGEYDIAESPMVRRKRAHDVADEIGSWSSGEFRIGDRLPLEKDLMQRFGVGRPAVREALFFLEQQGMVNRRWRARARFPLRRASHSPVHATVEASCRPRTGRSAAGRAGRGSSSRPAFAWLAATVASDEDIKRLKTALDTNVAAVGDRVKLIRTDVAFHYEIAVITRNPIFTMVHEAVVDWLVDQPHHHVADHAGRQLPLGPDDTAIYEAIAAHDPAAPYHDGKPRPLHQ